MTVKFKKGDKVFYLGCWVKGRVFIREETVESWGTKTATLSLVSSGEMSKRQVQTPHVNMEVDNRRTHHFLPASIGREAAEAEAMRRGAVDLAQERAHYEHCLTRSEDPHYLAAIRRDLEALPTEPSFFWR